MAVRPLTEEELRRGVVAFNPTTPGMAEAAASAVRGANPAYAGMEHQVPAGEGVWPTPPAPMRQAPPEVVARQPGPPPAKIAANRGVMGPPRPAADVPRETSPASAEPAKEKPKDMHAFSYLGQVNAMEAKAMALGRPEEAARIRTAYNTLIDGQFSSMETDYKTKTLPQVQEIQSQILAHQGKQVPKELVIKARETVQQAAAQQKQMMGYLYGLARNDSTKGLGIKYFNESELIEPGVRMADLVIKDGMLIGTDANGQPVKLSTGEDFVVPLAAAEQLYRDLFESERKDNVIVPYGSMVVNTNTGSVVAHNKRDPNDRGDTTGNDLSAVRFAYDSIATGLNLKLSDTGKLMADIGPKELEAHSRLTAEAGTMIRNGVPPEQAVETVLKKYRGEQGAAAPGSDYSGTDWRR